MPILQVPEVMIHLYVQFPYIKPHTQSQSFPVIRYFVICPFQSVTSKLYRMMETCLATHKSILAHFINTSLNESM